MNLKVCMFKENESIKSTISDDAKIWRYMDVEKFKSLLTTRTLFFSCPFNFKDPWEGYLTSAHYDKFSQQEEAYGGDPILPELLKKHALLIRKTFAISCWHVSDFESEAFWRNYSEKGVVIQSTFGRMKKALESETEYEVNIGMVKYKDHLTEIVGQQGEITAFDMVLWKRRNYEYEKEMRAIIQSKEWWLEKDQYFDTKAGQNIKVDPDILIENIYTSPFEAGEEFNGKVVDIINSWGFDIGCEKSTLMKAPF